MSTVIGVLFFILSIYLGFIKANTFSFRKKYYEDFLSFNSKVLSEVSFSKKSIIDIIKTEKNGSDFIEKLNLFFLNKETVKYRYLNKEDESFFNEYFASLGKFGSEVEKQHLLNYEKQLKTKLEECKKLETKNKPFFIKISILIGAILFVIAL